MRPPPGAEQLTSAQIRTLVALAFVYERDGRASVRAVSEAAGVAGISDTFYRLARLRERGLVAWDSGRKGTLRPLVGRVDAAL